VESPEPRSNDRRTSRTQRANGIAKPIGEQAVTVRTVTHVTSPGVCRAATSGSWLSAPDDGSAHRTPAGRRVLLKLAGLHRKELARFEWGRLPDGSLILIDEVLTPDSSRFWPADSYRPGSNPPSFDKQFVRDWLEQSGWDKNSPPPPLPVEVVEKTRAKYLEAQERLLQPPGA